MSDAPRKARRHWILAPYILVVLVAAAWSAYWFTARGKIERGFDEQATILRQRGYDIGWAERSVSGFPFRFYVTVKQPKIVEPGGWGLSASFLEAEAAAYDPKLVVLNAPQGVTLRRPDGRAYAVKGEALRMSVGGYSSTPPRISIEGVKLAVRSAAGGASPPLPAIERFEAHLRPAANDRAQLFVRIDRATVAGEGLFARVAGDDPVTIGLEGELSPASALAGKSGPDLVRRWAEVGGGLDIDQGGISAGQSMLSLNKSRITADAEGRATGELSLSLTRASDGMTALGAIGVLPHETAAAAAGLAALRSPTGSAFNATLTFDGGRTFIGPLPIGAAPRLY